MDQCTHSSLQHETIHHHPTRSRPFNAALGSLPLALWLPYRIYRVTHLQHHRHRGRHLTDVERDPESFFAAPGTLARLSPIVRWAYRANCTLAGRLVLGPALSLARFWWGEARRMRAGDRGRQMVWLRHLPFPKLSWHQLPAAWERMRRGTLAQELIVEGGYRQVAQAFLFDPVMRAEHPAHHDAAPDRP